MKQFDASTRKSKRTRTALMETYLSQVPQTLSSDLLNVTVCCRYAESLLTNPRIKRYLARYHPEQLTEMQNLITEIEGTVRSKTQGGQKNNASLRPKNKHLSES